MDRIWALPIHELREKLKKKEISSRELTEIFLKRIEKYDSQINSYLTMNENALKEAELADEKIARAEEGELLGIPIALKDIFLTKDLRTTCASKILENFIPPFDSTVVEKLKKAGYVLLGKVNLDEFAMGSSTENSAFGPTHNPWDLERAPGGSSGGSSAAMSARLATGTLGTDTGGSIRQPAAFCGVVGLKPTYGRVTRYGIIAFASSLDQVGPITADVEDAAILLKVVAGKDPRDSTSVDREVPDYPSLIKDKISGLTAGLPKEYFDEGVDPEVRSRIEEAIEVLKKLGVKFKEISLPHTEYAIATYYIVAPAEASSNLARYDGIRYGLRVKGKDLIDTYFESRSKGFGSEVKRRIMLGTYALSAGYYDAYYLKALKVRTIIRNDFLEAFKNVDVIITPTTPTPAFKLGEKISDPLQMYLSDIFTVSVNLAGLPGISIPVGFTSQNLPVGMQIIGKPFDEVTIMKVGYNYQQETDWHRRIPEAFQED